MRTAETKSEALHYKEENIRFQYDSNMMNTFVIFLKDIGAGAELGSTKESAREFVTRLHEKLTVENPMVRPDLKFHEIYPKWMTDVMYGRATRNGNNISAFARCFNEWYKTQNFAPKVVSPKKNTNTPTKMDKWTDNDLQRRYAIIKGIEEHRAGVSTLFDSQKAKSYFNRVKNEYIQRFGTAEI